MDKEIRNPYYFDMAVIVAFLILTWTVMIFTVYEIIALASTVALKTVIVIAAGSAVLFATASLFGVMAHLRKSRQSLYREDLAHRKIHLKEIQ